MEKRPDRRLLGSPKKNADLTTLVLTIYDDRVLLVVVVITLVVVLRKSRTSLGAM